MSSTSAAGALTGTSPTFRLRNQRNAQFSFVVLPNDTLAVVYNSSARASASNVSLVPTFCVDFVPKIPPSLSTAAFYIVQASFSFSRSEFQSPIPSGWTSSDTVSPYFKLAMSSTASADGSGIDDEELLASEFQSYTMRVGGLQDGVIPLSFACDTVRAAAGATAPRRLCEMVLSGVNWIGAGRLPSSFVGSGVWSYEGLASGLELLVSSSGASLTIAVASDSSVTLYPGQIITCLVQNPNAAGARPFMPFSAALSLVHNDQLTLETAFSQQGWMTGSSSTANTVVSATTSYTGSDIQCGASSVFRNGAGAVIDEWGLINEASTSSISSANKTAIRGLCFNTIKVGSNTGLASGKVVCLVNRSASSATLSAGDVVATIRWISPGSWVARNDSTHVLHASWSVADMLQGLALTPAAAACYAYNVSNGGPAAAALSSVLPTASTAVLSKVFTFAKTAVASYTAGAAEVAVRRDQSGSTLRVVGSPSVCQRFHLRLDLGKSVSESISSAGILFSRYWIAREAPSFSVSANGSSSVTISTRVDMRFSASNMVEIARITSVPEIDDLTYVASILLKIETSRLRGAQAFVEFWRDGDGSGTFTYDPAYVMSGYFSESNDTLMLKESDGIAGRTGPKMMRILLGGGSMSAYTARAGIPIVTVLGISPPQWINTLGSEQRSEVGSSGHMGSDLTVAAGESISRFMLVAGVSNPSCITTISNIKKSSPADPPTCTASYWFFDSSANLISNGDLPADKILVSCSNDRFTSPTRTDVPADTTYAISFDPAIGMDADAHTMLLRVTLAEGSTSPVRVSTSDVTRADSAYRNPVARSLGVAGTHVAEFAAATAAAGAVAVAAVSGPPGVAVATTLSSATTVSALATLRAACMVGKSSTSSITRALTLENTAGAAITIARVSPQCALIGAVDLDSGANLSVSSGSLSLASGSSARLLIASYGRASASAADLNIALASPTSMSGSSTVLTITANDRLPSAMRAAACWSIRQLNSALFMQEGPHSEIVLGVSPSASGLLQANDVLLSLDLNAEIGSAHASSMLPIAGVARAVAPSAIPVSLGFNGGGGLLPGQEPSVWSASGAFSEPPADEGETLPAQRTITFYYAGGDTISLADIRARMVLSIPFISPPDPFLASDAPSSAPIAMLSTSSAPETIVKTSSSAPSRLVAPLFSAERLAESPIINALVTCSVAPSVTVEQGAGTAVTSAHRSVGSFLSNVSIQAVSAPCRASFGIPPAHTQESAAVSLRRVGQ